jgi:hypothetical protein
MFRPRRSKTEAVRGNIRKNPTRRDGGIYAVPIEKRGHKKKPDSRDSGCSAFFTRVRKKDNKVVPLFRTVA